MGFPQSTADSRPAVTVEQLHAQPAASASHCRRLADLITLTRDMLARANEGDWDAVTRMERQRRDGLTLCFAEPVSEEVSELVAEALAAMLHLNDELMEKLRGAHEKVLRTGVEQARTRSAIHQYQGVLQAPN